MKSLLSIMGLNLLVSSLCWAAAPEDIEVSEAYVRALPPNVPNTAAYMTLVNRTGEDLALVGGSASVAEEVSVHETVSENGQMGMRHVMQVPVPAGGEVMLAPGGLHLMLTGLKRALREGDEVSLTLHFRGGLEKEVVLPVERD